MDYEKVSLPALGTKAPDFTADSTMGPISLSDYGGKWVILFSHPGDFTPVCTTEFIALAKAHNHFLNRNTQLLALSVDSNAAHIAWMMDILRSTEIEIPFPLLDDRGTMIAMRYGMLPMGATSTLTVRSVFYIDPNQIVRAILCYPASNGRSIPELLRLLDALQFTDATHTYTPADWHPGQPGIRPAPPTFNAAREALSNPDANMVDWYLNYAP